MLHMGKDRYSLPFLVWVVTVELCTESASAQEPLRREGQKEHTKLVALRMCSACVQS